MTVARKVISEAEKTLHLSEQSTLEKAQVISILQSPLCKDVYLKPL